MQKSLVDFEGRHIDLVFLERFKCNAKGIALSTSEFEYFGALKIKIPKG